ncbi:MAG: PTS sugar transporter subunit IIB [Thermoanaerobacteraceae bacterium]|nr:PTS sugar transporter subunit IIB [Thermoanaerobacteraceae bacterium]
MKILTVCGLGQGTSLLLRMNVEEVLNELKIQAEVDHMDASYAASENADLILTSPQLAPLLEQNPAQKIIINNYFDKNEIKEKLKEYFNI